jgi:hypothetical protein
MYSLIFLAAMANVDAVSRLAQEDGTPTLPRLAWCLFSGAALVAIDFPGLFYFAIGAACLALKWLRTGHGRLLPILILPLLPLSGFFLANRSLVADLLRWKPEGDEAALFAGFYDFLKLTYLSLRPGLELVYAAPLPTSFALILGPAILAVILWCAFRQAIDARGRRAAEPLIPLLALCRIVTDTELARRAAELNGRPFLFVSQMGGKRALIDIHQLAGRTPRLVRGYVPLESLPYNDLWKRRYAERAEQPDAIDVWIVR